MYSYRRYPFDLRIHHIILMCANGDIKPPWPLHLTVAYVSYTALTRFLRFIPNLSLLLSYSICVTVSFTSHHKIYLSAQHQQNNKYSSHFWPVWKKHQRRGTWIGRQGHTQRKQDLFMAILQLSLGSCPEIVALIPHCGCWTFVVQRVLSPSVTSAFPPAIKYG